MTPHPKGRTERAARRNEIRLQFIEDAIRTAEQSYRSMKCAASTRARVALHADVEGGCANNGDTCLCECHDQPDVWSSALNSTTGAAS